MNGLYKKLQYNKKLIIGFEYFGRLQQKRTGEENQMGQFIPNLTTKLGQSIDEFQFSSERKKHFQGRIRDCRRH